MRPDRALILLTRPAETPDRLAESLHKRGHETMSAPVLSIRPLRPLSPACAGEAPQGILVTSRHALPALVEFPRVRALCVGAETAEALAAMGFPVAAHAHAARALADLAREHFSPGGGAVLYVRGEHVSHDLAGDLGALGFTVAEHLAYAADAAPSLPAHAVDALAEGRVRAALFLSRRSAEIFLSLAEGATLAGVHAVAFSGPIARVLERGGWRSVSACETPSIESLSEAVDKRLAAD